jgi:purine-binding chemotaxis protein CheW
MSILPERKPVAPIPAPALLDERAALTSYLASLFAPAPMYYPVPVTPTPVAPPVVEVISPAPTIVVAPPVAEEAVVVPVTAPVAPAPVETVVTETATAAPTAPAPGGIPEWGRQPFACLLLRVNGLNLALPLVKLNRILPWTEPGALPGYAPWMLGILRHLDQNVRVIDTATLVMPEIKKSIAGTTDHATGEDTRRIVLIDDGRWGLVCDGVSEVITLDPAKIRWRQGEGKRPWMAGMVTEQLCALLDVERLAAMLSAGCADLADEAAPAATPAFPRK